VRQAAGEEPQAGLIELLAGVDDAEAVGERVADAIGFAGGAADGSEAAWAVRRLFESLARKRPLVAVFEDIHWAEPTLLDLIEHVADLSRDAPMLLLCLARTELLDERPGWAGGKLNASTILLEPLSEHECVAVVDELGADTLEPSSRGRIVHASEGNPLLVEQMLALLVEGGEPGALPPTIESLLAARLDRLPEREREVLERAAVEGTQFHLGAVATLLGDGADLDVLVTALVRKELVRPDRPSPAGEMAFRFRHVLVRDAAYAGLPKSARADLHDRFARWVEEKTAERAVEYEEIVGYHLEQSVRARRELGLPEARTAELAKDAAERLVASG